MHLYLGRDGKTYGPYPEEQLREWAREGRVDADDVCCPVGTSEWVPISTFCGGGSGAVGVGKSFADLKPHLLNPLSIFWSFSWVKDWKTLSIVLLGLFPLVSIMVLFEDDLSKQYWSIALYFSALWAFFFNALVKPEGTSTRNILICFFGTGISCLPILMGFYEIEFFADMARQAGSEDFLERFIGMFFGVAILEEASKLAVLVVIWKWFQTNDYSVRTFMFYGLMSGLGFGIYEGIDYQTGRNIDWIPEKEVATIDTETLREEVAFTYLFNIARLTTLPFLHAIWCAIAGMFFGLSTLYGYRWLLIGAGLVVPALLHAGHNSMNNFLGGWGVALVDMLSVIVLLGYWRDQEAIEKTLRS